MSDNAFKWMNDEIDKFKATHPEIDWIEPVCKNALEILKCYTDYPHDNVTLSNTQYIVNRLLSGRPLTPIEESDNWTQIEYKDKCCKAFKCDRMSSLIKFIYENGDVKYSDLSRFICIDIDDNSNQWLSKHVNSIMDDLIPITMPYDTVDTGIAVVCKRGKSNVNLDENEYDLEGIIYCILPDGHKVDINRFFKYVDKKCYNISETEFNDLIKNLDK